eukprot:9316280-Alexandrium_andersonii.AAC.1
MQVHMLRTLLRYEPTRTGHALTSWATRKSAPTAGGRPHMQQAGATPMPGSCRWAEGATGASEVASCGAAAPPLRAKGQSARATNKPRVCDKEDLAPATATTSYVPYLR